MRQSVVFLLSLGIWTAFGQTPSDPLQSIAEKRVELASREVERMRQLTEVGAVARARIEEAEQDLADAQDTVVLARTLNAPATIKDANDQTIDDMLAAAQRRLDRQQARVDQARKLVAMGLTAQSYVAPFEQELATRQTDLVLARSRAEWMREMIELSKAPGGRAAQQIISPNEYQENFSGAMEHYEGDGAFNESKDLKPLELAFERKFGRLLPISAEGETDTHRALGFDHRGRVDVAVVPSAPEGVWLRQYLQSQKIPYYAFNHAVPGKATGAHIHIGPGSTRLHDAD